MGLIKNKKRHTVIIGCGRLGATIASALSDKEKNVIIVDTIEDSFRKLSPSYAGQIFVGDATVFSVLEEISIQDAESVIIVTHSDNTNIMIAQIVKEKYGVEKVIARLYDPERDVVYRELGIETIYPAYLESKQLLEWCEEREGKE